MQKRICSIILSLALVLGCFAGTFSFTASAATYEYEVDHSIDFSDPTKYMTNASLTTDPADADNSVIKFSQINYSTQSSQWPNTVQPANNAHTVTDQWGTSWTGEKYQLVAGTSYVVTADYKVVTAGANFSLTAYTSDYGSYGNYDIASSTKQGATWISGSATSGWASTSVSFVATKTSYLTLCLINADANEKKEDQEIYLDNIKIIKQPAPTATTAVTTFDDPHQTFLYDYSNMMSFTEIVNVSAIGGTGNALKMSAIAQSNEKGWPPNFKLASISANGAASKLEVIEGAEYTVSMKVYCKTAEHGHSYMLVYCEDANNPVSMFKDTAPDTWTYEYFDSVWHSTTSDWVTISKTFTAKKSGQLTLLLNSTGKADNQEIYFDDITVVRTPTPVYNGKAVSFDEYQTYYYENNNMFGGGKIADTGDTTHGMAYKMTQLRNISNSGWNIYAQNIMFAGVAEDGSLSKFKVEEGKKYTISFDMFRKTNSHEFGWYILYLNDNNNPGNILGNASVSNWADKEKFGWYGATGTGWDKVSHTFTAKKTGYISLTPEVYSDLWDAEIFLDNLRIKEVTSNTNIDFNEEFYTKADAKDASYAKATLETLDDGHGNVIHFNSIASTWSNENGSKWPNTFVLADNDGDSRLSMTKGKTYRITYDIKIENAPCDFTSNIVLIGSDNGIGAIDMWWTHQTLSQHYTNTSGSGKWETKTVEFTNNGMLGQSVAESGNPVIVLRNSNTGEQNAVDASVYFDNIIVEESLGNLTINNVSDGYTVAVYNGQTYADLKVSAPAGAVVEGLYYDADFTQKATGAIDLTKEVYAKFKTAVGDFDTTVNLAVQGNYAVEELVGTKYSKGLSSINAQLASDGRFPDYNSSWPAATWFINADGTNFKTIAGHRYTVSYDYKIVNPESLENTSTVALTKKQQVPDGLDFGAISYTYSDADGKVVTTVDNPKYIDENYRAGWQSKSYTFTADAENMLYILSYMNGPIIFDNVKLIDHDNADVKTIVDEQGAVIAAGFAGEEIEYAPYDAEGDTNFVYYKNSDGTKFDDKYIKDNATLTKHSSEIAVTAATADVDSNKLELRVRFEDIYSSKSGDGYKLETIISNDIEYNINEIGMLVIPTAKLGGEALTIDTEGAYKFVNGDLHYNTRSLTVIDTSVVITPDRRDTEYSVVGYVKTNGKIIYSETRHNLKTSINDVLGMEDIDGEYTMHGYSLSSANEFNAGTTMDDVLTDFYSWDNYYAGEGFNSYSTQNADNLYLKDVDGKSALTINTIMESETVCTSTRLHGNKHFTYGYMEVRAKFASEVGGSIWLNSAGIDVNDLAVQPGKDESGTFDGTNDFVYPEIDIVEFTDASKGKYKVTLHLWEYLSDPANQKYQHQPATGEVPSDCHIEADVTEWHTYGFLKTESKMEFYVDGSLVYVINRDELPTYEEEKNDHYWTEYEINALFNNPTYLIFSTDFSVAQAVGTNAESYIDYIRVYE